MTDRLPRDNPLQDVIDRAYEVFAYPVPSQTCVCRNCCMSPEIEATFFDLPRQDMPLSYLQDWYGAAYEPPIDRAVWGYLLPRILEALACGKTPTYVLAHVLNRYPTGEPSAWSREEWSALDAFQKSVFRNMTHFDWALADLIGLFTDGGWAFGPLLRQVLEVESETLVRKLHSDWVTVGEPFRVSLPNTAENQRLADFFASSELQARVDRVLQKPDTDADIEAMALDLIDLWHPSF